MKTFHKQLQDRLEATGDFSQPMWHFMADVLEHAATEADKWTNRADDARRIPDVIDEAVRFCRENAKAAEVCDPVVRRLEGENEELRKQIEFLHLNWGSDSKIAADAMRELSAIREEIHKVNPLRSDGPLPYRVRQLCDDVEATRKERDEAREAARWLFNDDNGHTTEDEIFERWPWLEETT